MFNGATNICTNAAIIIPQASRAQADFCHLNKLLRELESKASNCCKAAISSFLSNKSNKSSECFQGGLPLDSKKAQFERLGFFAL
jgi:hypothetical protein